MPGQETIARTLNILASPGTSGYVLAVVKPPLDEADVDSFVQPDPTMPPAEVGSFRDKSQFFAYHQASIDFMGPSLYSTNSKEQTLIAFAERLASRVEGLEFSGNINPLPSAIEHKILKVQQARSARLPGWNADAPNSLPPA